MYSKGLAYFLWLISGCGILGFHRFYLGKIFTGVLWMCSGGLAGLGALYDLLTLGKQVDIENARRNYYSTVHHYYHNAESGGTRYAEDAAYHTVHDEERGGANESTEHKILKIAREKNGVVTAGEIALQANISLDDAKKQLESMVLKGHAEMRVRSSGTVVFTFPDFMDPDAPLEDF